MESTSKRKIAETLLELAHQFGDVNSISINQIIKDSGISRSTFYKYFQSKKDIFTYIHHNLDAPIFKKCCQQQQNDWTNQSANIQDALNFVAKEVLPLLFGRHKVIKLLYNSSIDPYWQPFLEQRYLKWAAEIIKVSPHNRLGVTSPFSHILIVKIILGVLSAWITSPFPEEPTTFHPKFIRISNSIIQNLG